MKAVQEWREDPEVREAAKLAIIEQGNQATEVVRLLKEANAILVTMAEGPLGRDARSTLYQVQTRTKGAERWIDHLTRRTEPNETYIGNIAAFNGDRLCPEKGWQPPPPSEDW